MIVVDISGRGLTDPFGRWMSITPGINAAPLLDTVVKWLDANVSQGYAYKPWYDSKRDAIVAELHLMNDEDATMFRLRFM